MKLTSGKITIPVERDGVLTGEIAFDPEDIAFAQGFYDMMEGLTQRESDYAALTEADAGARLRQMLELCNWIRAQIDGIFGTGTSAVLFGEQCSLTLFRQFFEGVEPLIRKGRAKKVAKYRDAEAGVMK